MKLIRYNFFIGLMLLVIMFVSSCSIETYATKKDDANQEILTYILDNNIDATPKNSGLVFIPISNGEGDCPNSKASVAFHYKGYYMNGDVFDSSATYFLLKVLVIFTV